MGLGKSRLICVMVTTAVCATTMSCRLKDPLMRGQIIKAAINFE
jgi:hypothetical protein